MKKPVLICRTLDGECDCDSVYNSALTSDGIQTFRLIPKTNSNRHKNLTIIIFCRSIKGERFGYKLVRELLSCPLITCTE